MARPGLDADATREKLLSAAEVMLAETGGQRLILSELARRVGLSQSHAHNFFATKADLVRGLAARWFAEIDSAVAAVQAAELSPQDALRDYVLTILRLKRARLDADPALFRAYLDLAAGHSDIVAAHAGHLRDVLRAILARQVPPPRLEAATDMVLDATVAFRVPHMIALNRAAATDARARRVVAMCQSALDAGLPSA